MLPDTRKAILIAQREYLENIRAKGFWLSIALLPVLFLIAIAIPVLLAERERAQYYAVMDESGWLQARMQEQIVAADLRLLLRQLARNPLAQQRAALSAPAAEMIAQLQALSGEEQAQQLKNLAQQIAHWQIQANTPAEDSAHPNDPQSGFVRWWLDSQDRLATLIPEANLRRFRLYGLPNADATQLNELLLGDHILGYFVIPADPVADTSGAEYVSRNLTNLDLQRWYSEQATRLIRDRRLQEQGLDQALAQWLQASVHFHALQIDRSGQTGPVAITDRVSHWVPVAFVYLLWIAIMSITQRLLTNTVEEKSNKLVEMLLSSVAAIDLMSGKILGIAATGLTMLTAWLLIMLALFTLIPTPALAEAGIDLAALLMNPIYLGSFLLYFLLGYLLYAALLCSIGSFANNLKEAQNLVMPVQLGLVLPLLLMIPIGRDPGGTLAQVMSFIPPFTPFVMMNRAAQPPDAMTYVLTTALLLVSIYLALRIAARVFATGILMTGKPPRLRQLLALLRGK